jgi:hypothetical protein
MSEWYAYDHDAACPCFGNASSLDLVTNYISALTGSATWGSVVGSSRFIPDGQMTFNWWIKNDVFTQTNSSTIQYFIVVGDVSYGGVGGYEGTLSLRLDIGTGGGVSGLNQLYFSYTVVEARGTFFNFNLQSRCAIDESTGNSDITGVIEGSEWDINNMGNVNPNDFTMLTMVYDYANAGTNDLVVWYWNGRKLSTPYQDPGVDYRIQSWTFEYADPPLTLDWGDSCASMGSNIMACSGGFAEVGMHQLIDEFSMWGTTALDSSDIQELYDGLSYQSVPGGVKTLCVSEMATNLTGGAPTVHYAFETGSNLGYAYGAAYHLGDYNTPLQSSDNA